MTRGESICLLHLMCFARSMELLQHTVRNEPHQNGVAERFNRTFVEGATSMLSESKLPPSFWGYAVNSFVHTHNRSPSSSIGHSIPFTRLYKRKPDVSHFRVFGSTAYVHVQKDKRKGLQSHTEKCFFIGYPAQYKGWLFYNRVSRKTRVCNVADFDERSLPGSSEPSTSPLPTSIPPASSPSQVVVEDDDQTSHDSRSQVGADDDLAPHAPSVHIPSDLSLQHCSTSSPEPSPEPELQPQLPERRSH